jgi:mRNA-degrading endonuclease RelE of RelBE toxin-antitoxin system
MITLSSIDELKAANEALEKFQKDYPNLFKKLLDIVNLTRAFQFKYQYMGCLIMNEDPGQDSPNFVYSSVLRLYKKELQKLKDDQNSQVLKQTFSEIKNIGYAKISLLVSGMTPESLVGASSIK